MLSLPLNPAKNILRLLKLPTHTCLGEIHEVLWVMHNCAVDYVVPHPGVQTQRTRLVVILAPVMGDIDVNLVRQALDFSLRADTLVVDEKQINIGCATKQRVASK